MAITNGLAYCKLDLKSFKRSNLRHFNSFHFDLTLSHYKKWTLYYMYVCIFAFIHIHIHIYIYTYMIYIYIYTYIYDGLTILNGLTKQTYPETLY